MNITICWIALTVQLQLIFAYKNRIVEVWIVTSNVTNRSYLFDEFSIAVLPKPAFRKAFILFSCTVERCRILHIIDLHTIENIPL